MKNKKLIISLGSISLLTTFPLVAASCGREVETPEKKIQDNFLKAAERKEEIKNIWRQVTLASLYNINVTASYNTDNSEYIKTFNDSSSQLYKDSYEAFKVYAEEKIFKNGADGFYFTKKNLEWKKNNYFTDDQEKKMKFLTPSEIPSEEIFKILWNAEKTGIRSEVQKLLFVQKYFEISDKEKLTKLYEKFKYNSSFLKYELENYNLTKYVLEKKPVQLWRKTANTSVTSEEAFFVTQQKTIKSIDTFNEFMNDSEDKDKKRSELEKISDSDDDEKQLLGYQGINLNFSEYNLKWDEKNLTKTEASKLFGFYAPSEDRLVQKTDQLFIKGYNPYQGANADKKIIVAYVNQIAPIGQAEIELPTEADEKKTEKVKLLSFKGTKYEKYLKKISLLFTLKDSSLVDTAEQAFIKLGYKLKIENETLKEILKGEKFVDGLDETKK
ncbi:variable surface lipoprotein [Mycoplasmopsis caviae]|uniref:Variable surface lipoprotein n=1 Tax=Mycoplasmopsis caviae TaxID=55603 RepID=A0A3P8K8M4_9BACT|nr:variable surface lipoprotein [Mycoplasmopsis caviae]UUD35505.1 variable surface lipoprotein [Mycoplasmopsis caviae]VDR41719.1 Uncharacterised protein [Mycoplasmopsis caviae]